MSIDLEELAAIIELLDKTEFTQFRFEKGDLRIAVSRGDSIDFENGSGPATAPSARTASAAPAAPAAVTVPSSVPVATDGLRLADDEVVVRSPMLGTFYRSPKPGDPAFVQEGSPVEPDSVLCIIEVMKLMNSVTAAETGVVRRILVGEGDLVEFDQPLFVIGRQ